MVRRLFAGVFGLGLVAEDDSRTRKYAHIVDGAAVIAVLLTLATIPLGIAPFLDAKPVVMACCYVATNGATLALSRRRRWATARLVFGVATLIHIAAIALFSTIDSLAWLYLLVLVAAFVFYFPAEEGWRGRALGLGAVVVLGVIHVGGVGGLAVIGAIPAAAVQGSRLANLIGAGVSLLTFVALANRASNQAEARLADERARSDFLLANILPRPIIERLKREERYIAERFEETSILFADIVGFTGLAATRPPEEVVALLGRVFTDLDRIAATHGVEKIKTIGDAYMAVVGAPIPAADHWARMARFALDARDRIAEAYAPTLSVRIGVHSGPVVAGIIGEKKFAYDLWGDAVNLASRMESHGIPGQIHCSAAFHERAREGFVFEARGTIEVKGMGRLATFVLVRAEGEGAGAGG